MTLSKNSFSAASNGLLKNSFVIDPAHKPLRNDITEHTSHSALLVASARFSAASKPSWRTCQNYLTVFPN
jgi:hypothetical protein